MSEYLKSVKKVLSPLGGELVIPRVRGFGGTFYGPRVEELGVRKGNSAFGSGENIVALRDEESWLEPHIFDASRPSVTKILSSHFGGRP